MPVYLDEDMVGHDLSTIGFPHLLLCMGFVARTNNDLWGVHLTSVDNAKATVAAFWTWAQGKGLTASSITDLYGSCNHKVRYGTSTAQAGVNAWTTEMASFASMIGYTGPARGFDTSIIDPKNGTFVRYEHQTGGGLPCKIFYKRDEKTEVTGTAAVKYDGGTADVASWNPNKREFRPTTYPKTGIVVTASVTLDIGPIHETLRAGTLHEVDYALRLTSITV